MLLAILVLLQEKEVAQMLSCTVAALRRWRREGRGPRYAKLGRLVRYREADVDDFVRDRLDMGTLHREANNDRSEVSS